MSSPTVISTFSGPGGSSLGYERAGCDVRAALDCAPGKFSNHIPATYQRNHPDTTFIEQDARETTGDELLDAAGVDVGDLDILDGSPPCSPFSTANAQKNWGDHESGTLFDRYVYFIDELRPRAFVAENVPDLAQGKTKGYFKTLIREMRNAGPGYDVQVQNIDAAYLGAPHHRRRLMFIGTRSDMPDPPSIRPTGTPTTVREAWEGLEQEQGKIESARKRCERSDRYKWIKKLPADAKTRIYDVRTDGKTSGWDSYRLSFSKPSNTLTSKRGALVHPAEDRYLTIAEAKRLTGLPDDYECPNWETVIRCLPPIMLETIATELQETVLP